MDPEKIKAAIEAIKAGDAEAALALLEEMIVSAAGGVDSALDNVPEETPSDELLAKLTALTNAENAEAALLTVEKLVSDNADRLAALGRIDLHERKALVKKLVELGVDNPGTAYKDPETGELCDRLAKEPLVELRSRVKALSAGPTPGRITPPTATRGGKQRRALTRVEQQWCEKNNVTEEQFWARHDGAVRSAK